MSKSKGMLPKPVLEILQEVGIQIDLARKRRRLTITTVCEAAGITAQTYRRMIRGEPGVAVAVIAAVLHALDLESTMLAIADPTSDRKGLALDYARLSRTTGTGDDDELDTNF